MASKGLTLVIGSSGKTGRRVAERLCERGMPYRPGSRSAHPAFDWENPATWQPSLDSVSQAYVTYFPDLCVPGAVQTVQAFFEQAVRSGAKKLVLLSGRGEMEAEQAEQALKAVDVDWTILRCSFFNQNFSESYFMEPILAGEVALPVRPVAEAFVDVEDIADVAVAALTEPGHSRQLYELTGPRALTFAEAVDEIARATGREIRYVAITPQEYKAALVDAGIPPKIVELTLYLFETVLDGRNTSITDGVLRALKRPPRDFSTYVRNTAKTGVWGEK